MFFKHIGAPRYKFLFVHRINDMYVTHNTVLHSHTFMHTLANIDKYCGCARDDDVFDDDDDEDVTTNSIKFQVFDNDGLKMM